MRGITPALPFHRKIALLSLTSLSVTTLLVSFVVLAALFVCLPCVLPPLHLHPASAACGSLHHFFNVSLQPCVCSKSFLKLERVKIPFSVTPDPPPLLTYTIAEEHVICKLRGQNNKETRYIKYSLKSLNKPLIDS